MVIYSNLYSFHNGMYTLSCTNRCNKYKYHCQIPFPILFDVRYQPKEQGRHHEGYEY